ncbi:MAG: hypothetical protein H8E62_00650 [Planctomycetes bacterium]|nr:hypothetical protein [Planctomycetota bacterium]
MNSGCDVFGLLASPGAFEKKTVPEYNLLAQQARKILLWVECPRSSEADYDVKDKLTAAYLIYLTERVGIPSEKILLHQPAGGNTLVQDPIQVARDLDAGCLLLIQVYDYEMLPLNMKKYYTGEMVTRAVLMDVDLRIAVWPRDPSGKIIHVGVDMETKGRDAALGRLVSATVHCTLRYLYPCEKLKFKTMDERISIQNTFEM